MIRSRFGVILVLAILLATGLTARLFSISVLDHSHYVALANDQQNIERNVLPTRGTIYGVDTTTGRLVTLVASVERFSLSVTPKNVTHPAEYARLLAAASGKSEEDLLTAFTAKGAYLPPLKHNLDKTQAENLMQQINDIERTYDPKHLDVKLNFDPSQGSILYALGGVFFTREYQRAYPEGGMLAQALGFVDDSGKGRYGLEGEYDKELQGYQGTLLLQRDSLGTLLGQQELIDGQNGSNYVLSIDRNIQAEVEKQLTQSVKDAEATGGSVIVIDPHTGEIMAMAATPTYDPAGFRDLSQDQIGLFDNPTISQEWEPGSIFKPLVMAAALDTGVVTPQTEDTFGATVTVDGHVINTALRRAYGKENMTQVLANSDNVAMVWVTDKLGNQSMYDYLQRFGFGSSTGIDLQNEIRGRLLPLNQWRNINRATMSFGQGIAVTPMQVLTAYAAIANNGKMVQPHMVKAVVDGAGNRQDVPPIFGAQVVKPEIAKELRDMMVQTVLSAHNRAGTEGYKIGGKTGTAQIPDPEKGGYIDNAYNHSFVGFGPSDDPRYVMLVKIDHPNVDKVGLFAESTTVPLFGRLSTFLLNYFQIPPTNR